MLLVASSRTMIELRRSNALAMAISCLCPWEKLVPPGETFVSKDTVVFASTSVDVADTESVVSSWMDAGRDVAGVDNSEGARDVRREGY